MKQWFACAAFCALFLGFIVSVGAAEQQTQYSPEDYEAAYGMLEASGASRSMSHVLGKMSEIILQANPQLEPAKAELDDFFKKNFSYDSMKKDLAETYLKHFSRDELLELKKFYETPLGRKIAEKQPLLTMEASRISQNRAQAVLPELQAIIKKYAAKKSGESNAE